MTDEDLTSNLLDQLSADAPTHRMRSRFEQLVDQPPRRPVRRLVWTACAAASILVIAGLMVLRVQRPEPIDSGAATKAALDMLGAPSTFERLRGVSAAAHQPKASPELSLALLERLEQDTSINVRLAALGVLLDRDVSTLDSDRLTRALLAQETAIVQAHLGHRLRRRQLLSRKELKRILGQPEITGEARDALTRLEKL